MSLPETSLPKSPIALHKALDKVWGSGKGWQRFSAVNHTVIGKRFMVTALIFFAIGGVLAMLIRAQLATSGTAFVGPEIYNQIFTMHGTVMMFLFAIPMLEGLGIYLLPKMLGARDLAFPRITAFGYWCYLFGGTIIVLSMVFGVAPDSGWFMYTPLSSNVYTPGINADVWLLGVTFVEISAITAAVEITVSILKFRAPGMSLNRMPIFGWYMLVTALMMIVGFPPLILGSILLEVERAFDLPFFDPTRGGDPLLWQHLFWLFGHPEVYIIFLPAAGALSTIIPVFAQRPLIGYRAIIIAIVALAFLSFGLWVHHMFTVGIPHLALAFFSAASAIVAIPTAVQIFAWLATLAHGKPRFDVPMLYIVGFFIVFVLGGLTGVMLAMVPFNWQAHDSYFVVAHLHYVLVGGFVFPMLAAIYYWMPHVTGRQCVHRISVPAFWLIFIGFNLTFFLMHLTGLMGMPRRIYTYPSAFGWDWLNLLSSVGGFLLTMGFALVATDMILQFNFGRQFGRNPWKAGSLEWAMPTKPTSYNFASLPEIDRRADNLDVGRIAPELAAGKGYLGFVREGRMETIGVDMTTGKLEHVALLPNSSYLPLISAILTGGAVLSMLFSLYWLALILAFCVVGSFVVWSQTNVIKPNIGLLDVGRGEKLPPHTEVDGPVSWWANVFALLANGTLFASLLFGTIYNWLVAPNWPPQEIYTPGWLELGATAGFVLAGAIGPLIVRVNRNGGPFIVPMAVLAIVYLVTLALLGIALAAMPDPRGHAHLATTLMLLGYGALHCFIGLVFLLNAAIKIARGYIVHGALLELRIAQLWHVYTAVTGIVAVAMVLLMPYLIGLLERTP
ncbi:cytochrome c oxidase subunit I [Pelagibacterium lentulum]|uniref:cytochrome-c oxidase n=1 Tax=Pelagibacterium lentulum TaxID=2029865 RepID=A0A916RC52_9HYPH|nr:cytochrome c oxidase subunit I [Pelagibacterium lentulum]GGA49562.1 cytochrome ubiquinol oxidase subunit I [Pelagibacterium lentulum]